MLDDESTCHENRLGAVRDLHLAIQVCSIADDVLVMAADNILTGSLQGLVDYFHRKDSSVIMCYRENDKCKLQRTGVIVRGVDDRVENMMEKPKVPLSNWAVPPFYLYTKNDLPLIGRYVDEVGNHDAPGALACYMSARTIVYAWEMTMRRIDVGNLETYHFLRQKTDEGGKV